MYPWLQTTYDHLRRAVSNKRLPHALLLTGATGIGKLDLATIFTSSLFCEQIQTQSNPCGDCHGCRLVETRAHPNVLWLSPEKVGHAIKVDQIRDVSEFANQTSLNGEYRVIIIHPADSMNANAANALLKTLEEPPAHALILLVTDLPNSLPATILSRTQRVTIKKPTQEEALSWLATQLASDETMEQAALSLSLSFGAPLAALRLMRSDVYQQRKTLYDVLCALASKKLGPVEAAQTIQSIESLQLLDLLLSWIVDCVALKLNASTITNTDYTAQLSASKNQANVKQLNDYLHELQQMRGQVFRGSNFNKQLLAEKVFMRWVECATCN